MRRMTDLEPRTAQAHRRIEGRTSAPLDLLDLRQKETPAPPAPSQHVIDLNNPSKNRQQLLERIRTSRNGFYEALPAIASMRPFDVLAAEEESPEEGATRPDWTDRLERYDQAIATTLSRWRRHLRANRRRWWLAAITALTSSRQRLTLWLNGFARRRQLVAATLLVAGLTAVAVGAFVLTRPSDQPASGAPTATTPDRTNNSIDNATSAINAATSDTLPAAISSSLTSASSTSTNGNGATTTAPGRGSSSPARSTTNSSSNGPTPPTSVSVPATPVTDDPTIPLPVVPTPPVVVPPVPQVEPPAPITPPQLPDTPLPDPTSVAPGTGDVVAATGAL
jgi:hypothetical protein